MSELKERVRKAVEEVRHRPMSKSELQQQREAFAYGNLPSASRTTREEVKHALELMEGQG